MNNIFIASFIHQGIIGGNIILNDEALVFKTGKLTVCPEIRSLEIHYSDIYSVSNGLKLFLPTVTINLKNGKNYSFIIYNKSNFIKRLNAII